MSAAGRYLPEYNETKGGRDFFAVCRDPALASTITLQPIERFSPLIDAAIIFSDILVIPQAMGLAVEMLEGKGPHFPSPLRTLADLSRLRTSVDVDADLSYVFAAIRAARVKLAGRVPLIGFVGAPWTLLCYMTEGGGSKTYMHAKTWIYAHPRESQELLWRISDVCIEFLAKQIAAGAQMVQIFDSCAGELAPKEFSEFALPWLRYIAQKLPERLAQLGVEKVPMTVFAKGAWYALNLLCESGYQVVGLDWTHDPAEAMKIARGRVTLQGNMDPNVLYGGRKAITDAVERMIKGFGGGKKGYIVNLGHGITPFVNPEDLKWFFEECHRVGGAAPS